MALPGKHFDTFAKQVHHQFLALINGQERFKADVEVDASAKKHHISYKYIILDREQDLRIARTITISEIDLEDNFTVELEDALAEPYYSVKKRKNTYNADQAPAMEDFMFRQLDDFLNKDIIVKRYPAPAQVQHVQSLSSWLGSECRAELYLNGDEYGDEWKIRLVLKDTNHAIEEYLPPNVEGWVCAAIYRMYNRAFEKGRVHGISTLAERLAADEAKRVLDQSYIHNYDVKENLAQFIHAGSLDAIEKV